MINADINAPQAYRTNNDETTGASGSSSGSFGHRNVSTGELAQSTSGADNAAYRMGLKVPKGRTAARYASTGHLRAMEVSPGTFCTRSNSFAGLNRLYQEGKKSDQPKPYNLLCALPLETEKKSRVSKSFNGLDALKPEAEKKSSLSKSLNNLMNSISNRTEKTTKEIKEHKTQEAKSILEDVIKDVREFSKQIRIDLGISYKEQLKQLKSCNSSFKEIDDLTGEYYQALTDADSCEIKEIEKLKIMTDKAIEDIKNGK